MKPSKKTSDIVVGLIITALFCIFFYTKAGFLETVELKSYDLRMRLFPPAKASEEIVIVAIDDESIAKLGRWPWPRIRIADVIKKISQAGAKVIGLNIIFSEPEESSGLIAIDALEKKFSELDIVKAKGGKEFLGEIEKIKKDLNRDEKLAVAVEASHNVVFPIAFDFSSGMQTTVNADELSDSDVAAKAAIPGSQLSAPLAFRMIRPLPGLSRAAVDMGHINRFPDADGVSRHDLLLVNYNNRLYPSFPLAVAANFLGAAKTDILISQEGELFLKGQMLPATIDMQMLINYYGQSKTFPNYSFYDVLNDKIDPRAFKNKIILIGSTGLGIADIEATPVAPVFPGIERQATVISNILNRDFINKPIWADAFGFGMTLLFGLLTAFLLPRLGAKMGAYIGAGLVIAYTTAIIFVYASYGLWLNLIYPTLVLVFNYIAITSRRYLTVERQKQVVTEESDEANKLLGLTFQGKGMLDLAFEKFKAISEVDDEIKGVLYNLGLDFERKRMASKASSVYEHITKFEKNYKDIAERVRKLTNVATTGTWKGPKAAAEGTAIIDGMEKPTIGRYEIVEELGRGAMGVVYKGVDPTMKREVAIKTVHFDEVDADTIQSVKDRFFREAESAGKLKHPNIVTIYDVGEETDLAYIAMELLNGKTLEVWCKKTNLFPPKTSVKIIGQLCETLDYAHKNGIVHRDIKPANIMILAKGEIKVTDFGIAKIQSSSHTKTGVIMGTPSYMSPEQLAGQKVDGRSDLFSLGIIFYELITGEKPFKGDTITTIMYQIANAAPPPLKEYKKDLPPILQQLVDKALDKKPEGRFQTGKEFADAIRVCLAKMG
ncbi:MAG: CHASE2 domain-containing protein [Deltaproteobacteria bacterium]|nr:CHASE2 domain-containing protein [Deltaproteobacteria bacterium]